MCVSRPDVCLLPSVFLPGVLSFLLSFLLFYILLDGFR